MTLRIPQSSSLSRLLLSPSLPSSHTPSTRSAALSTVSTSRRARPIPPVPSRRRFATIMNAEERKHYLADHPPMVVRLEVEKHFEALNDKQKRYAHAISKAAFAGARIVLRQVSPESEPIYDMIIALHKSCNGDWEALGKKAGIEASELESFLEYTAQFLGNNGNYKSFGDAKMLPRCSDKSVAALAATSPEAAKFYEATNGAIFSCEKQPLMHLGFPAAGHMSNYYPDSPDITEEEINAVSAWMGSKGLLPENTRLRKSGDTFELLIASANTRVPANGGDIGKETQFTVEDGPIKGKTVKLVYGDYSAEMKNIAAHIREAAANADNENQKKMHLAYADSFESGSLESFKDSQRFWIKDKGPAVECNIGFIEQYRDPAGIRAEWEGFAAIVNKERTRAFGALVEASPELIPLLPWAKDFEKDSFLSPDFTSLEVLTFACAGIPAGINIPNYDDIRQNEGFKNVSLGNILSASAPNEKIPFIREEDLEKYSKLRTEAFEVQVGLHELTGHGCGKLLQETSPGVFNFDKENPPVSPITQKPVTTWYKPGQTWGSVFGNMGASYEECRAELVGVYLSCEFPVLKIFGYGDGTENMNNDAGDILFTSYLSMARSGLMSLEMWDPKSQKWGQAHSQARFSILKCFLDAGEDFCVLDYTKDDMSDLTVKLDRSKIPTVGRKAVGDYLQKIHVYKSSGDFENGSKLYNDMCRVDMDFWGTKVRNAVMAQKQPRKVFVQANTTLDEASGKVSFQHYDPTPVGLITSFADRNL